MRTSEQHRQDISDGDQLPVEKKDTFAMYLAGLLTVGLPCLLLVLLIAGVTLLLFGR